MGNVLCANIPNPILFCSLFQFDPENTGYISTEKFRNLLQRHGSELDPHKLEVLLALADNNSDGKICYQDFVNLVSDSVLIAGLAPGALSWFSAPFSPLHWASLTWKGGVKEFAWKAFHLQMNSGYNGRMLSPESEGACLWISASIEATAGYCAEVLLVVFPKAIWLATVRKEEGLWSGLFLCF